jgi:hypothetical protein
LRGGKAGLIAAVAVALGSSAFASISLAALGKDPKPSSQGHAQIVFSQSGPDTNGIGSDTFAMRFGTAKGKGQAADDCVVHEKREPRSFESSPFGLPVTGGLAFYLKDRRKPASIVVRRWASDPGLRPDARPETLPLRRLVAYRFEGAVSFWAARVRIPVRTPSWLEVRVAWPDPDDCAAGNDFVAAGVAFEPLPPPGG